MKIAELSPRLISAANFVRRGAVFADVGTDHAHLPIFLLSENIITRAVCSDINEGPLLSAKNNVAERGFSDRVELVLTDGAAALAGKGISDYAVCGMGGELIARIIDNAPQMRSTGVRLILQPMSKQAYLRRYLASQGFRIIDERFSEEPRHSYVTLLAEFCGAPYEIGALAAELGEKAFDPADAARISYAKRRLAALERALRGKTKSGADNAADEELCRLISNFLKG